MSDDLQFDPASQRWHVDRRIPVAFIISVFIATLVQSFAFGYWISNNTSRIGTLEQLATDQKPVIERLIRIEEQVSYIRDELRALKGGAAK
jgi:hypothetical protein